MEATLRRWLKSWSLFDIIKYVEEFFSKWVSPKWFILGHFFGDPLAKPLVSKCSGSWMCRDFLDMSGIVPWHTSGLRKRVLGLFSSIYHLQNHLCASARDLGHVGN